MILNKIAVLFSATVFAAAFLGIDVRAESAGFPEKPESVLNEYEITDATDSSVGKEDNTTSGKKQKTKSKSKKELMWENYHLSRKVDSLKRQMYRIIRSTYTADSLAVADDSDPLLHNRLRPEDYTAEITDSLLDIWYIHRQVGRCSEAENFNLDSVKFESTTSDKVYLERLADMNSFITLPFNEVVKNYIILYSEKMPTKVGNMLGLADYYFPIFEEIFLKYGMPEELKYMAVIESALNPMAVSRAGAAGMWQFIYPTGRSYGLTINSYVDERLDPVKSAEAAARYLRDAYKVFGDWNLAISSYNCGAGNVNKAIRRSGQRDFWGLYEHLPKETRGYVPAFVGAMYAFRYYKEHGLKPVRPTLPAAVDTFEILKMTHFNQISELLGVSVEELRNLNPQYIHDIIPGNEGYLLRLPYKYTAKYIEYEDSVYNYHAAEFFSPATLENVKNSTANNGQERIVYKVKSGDTLGKIAARHHVTVARLKEWNHLRNDKLKIGQKLVIYRRGKAPAPSTKPATTSQTGASAASPSGSPAGTQQTTATTSSTAANPQTSTASSSTIYVVKQGDTLYKIAQKYPGVSANDIMKENGIGSNIRPGMKLKIPCQ